MFLTTAITFFVILSILVFVHELGHFLVARLVGVTVEEFGFGLPPRIFGKRIKGKGTLYSINLLPIGGFVRLAGEDEETPPEFHGHPPAKFSHFFWAKSRLERSAILLAGVTMNFTLATIITGFLLTQGVLEQSDTVRVMSVLPGAPAADAGLQKDDIVEKITYTIQDGAKSEKLTRSSQLIALTKEKAGTPVVLDIVRNGMPLQVTLTPRANYPAGEGPMGISITDQEERKYPLGEASVKAVSLNFWRAKEMLLAIGGLIWRLVTFQPVGADVAGPIGIAQVTGEAVRFGWRAVLEFMSILSLNLAVLNILPIPALDGGRLLFIVVEKVFGRRVRPAFERSAHQIGMMLLIGLIVLISINDILRIVRG